MASPTFQMTFFMFSSRCVSGDARVSVSGVASWYLGPLPDVLGRRGVEGASWGAPEQSARELVLFRIVWCRLSPSTFPAPSTPLTDTLQLAECASPFYAFPLRSARAPARTTQGSFANLFVFCSASGHVATRASRPVRG